MTSGRGKVKNDVNSHTHPLQLTRPTSKHAAVEEKGHGGGGRYLPLTQTDAAHGSGGQEVVVPPSLLIQGGAACFYATASMLVIFVNKLVLTNKDFPSYFFIAISQFTSTCLVISFLRLTGHIKLARFDKVTLKGIAPLMIFFLGNTVTGLGSTKHINLPMFTVLRRFSILMTMILEKIILKSTSSCMVQLSVGLMIGGALVAAMFDLQFELRGYLLIAMNDLFTAAMGIAIKKALNLKIPQTSLLFYNSFFGAVVMTLVVLSLQGETERIIGFKGWRDPTFIALYICTSFMGSVLQYSIFLCTRVNSALTTAVVGCVKNMLITVVAMICMGQDYEFELINCAGIIVSMGGSFVYSWAKVTKR